MAYLTADDGCQLWYEERGAGPTIVFVHEFGGDHRSWAWQVEALSDRFRCVAYAARGFAPSDIPSDEARYGQDRSTRDLLNLVDGLMLDQFHLAGTSMGIFTSLDFTLSYGERVRSLTLVGNSSGPRSDMERESYRTEWIMPEVRKRLASGPDGALAHLVDDPAYQSFQKDHPDAWRIYADNLMSQPVDGAVHILKTLHWNRRSLWDDVSRLEVIACPVLLVHGADDYYLVGETNRLLERAIPQATRHCFDNTGHMANVERAGSFNRLLADHMSTA